MQHPTQTATVTTRPQRTKTDLSALDRVIDSITRDFTRRALSKRLQALAEITTDFFYLRFIGDRSIDEKDFGRIQRDRQAEMEKWTKRLKGISGSVKFGIVAANNHFAGFGRGTVNLFRKMLGMNELNLGSEPKDENQTMLTDF